MRHRHWLLIVGAPFLLVFGYWLAINNRSAMVDWIVLVAAVVIGLVGIWMSPWRRGVQVGASLAYVPMMGLALEASVLFLECSTGNCL